MARSNIGLSLACWNPVRNELLEVLRHMILSGEMEPGTRLVERELASRLGVSRTPIRECIRQLEIEGLVEHLPRQGCVVRKVSLGEVVEVFMIRASLEGLASRLAAERRTTRDIGRLKRILTQMETSIAQGDSRRIHELHVAFHEAMYRMAQSPRLAGMLRSLMQQSFWFARIAYGMPGRTEEALSEHKALLEAIEKGDPDLAEARTREHVERSRETYLRVQSEEIKSS